MRLSTTSTRWFIRLRWLLCAAVVVITWVSSTFLGVIPNPLPLYLVAGGMAVYNAVFRYGQYHWPASQVSADRQTMGQMACDLIALTAILYFSDIARNPFLFYFVFHMVIACMYLHGLRPYLIAALATMLVGGVLLAEHVGWIPRFPLHFPNEQMPPLEVSGLQRLGVFVAFTSTIWMAVYFTLVIHYYIDRTHEQLRQKEKMLGIGQLVAGIAHQIANPLDGVQNCLKTISEGVRDDERLTEYTTMMAEALERIEKTAKRVQAFARPRGIELRATDVNEAVEATLQLLGSSHRVGVLIETDLSDVPLVQGDPYTLQEVLFNLYANAVFAMPDGGTLTIVTETVDKRQEEHTGRVAIRVADTGVGIPRLQLEKIFEPFFTTRADSGGTGLGLGLCRMLISEMGGRIDVESTVGQGSTFTVILNQYDSETAQATQ